MNIHKIARELSVRMAWLSHFLPHFYRFAGKRKISAHIFSRHSKRTRILTVLCSVVRIIVLAWLVAVHFIPVCLSLRICVCAEYFLDYSTSDTNQINSKLKLTGSVIIFTRHGSAHHHGRAAAAQLNRNIGKNLNKFKIWCSILTACNSVNWL